MVSGSGSALHLPIGVEGINCLCFSPDRTSNLLAVGTNGGRVRIYNCMTLGSAVYQRRWHKTVRCLGFLESSPNLLVSASSQSGLKIHDIISGKRTWMKLNAHGNSPISSLAVIAHNQWATGDEAGLVKLWDGRRSDCVVELHPDEENKFDGQFEAINDLAVGGEGREMLFGAVDDGTLATYNIKRRRFETTSDTLGYSARTVAVVKNNRKVVMGTEEGIVSLFNWKEFEESSDRFPLRRLVANSRGHSKAIERIIKITEDVVAVATENGEISAVNIAPNRFRGSIGVHTVSAGGLEYGGDCLSLAVNPQANILASGSPASSTVRLWPLKAQTFEAQSDEEEDQSPPLKRKRKNMKRRLLKPEAIEHLSGLLSGSSAHKAEVAGEDSQDEDSDGNFENGSSGSEESSTDR
ncbi:unnamed protein product [Calicophoron daubneyi]|uniref:WD repeat-containing protein 55 n=1 Tax=Calicophoron daubneyi TaxID=300641 RepID=A0AAV2SZL9_CALDB